MTTSGLPAARFDDRLRRAQLLLPENDASALLIGWGTDLLWLTGYEAAASERLTMLVLPAQGKPTLVVPRLERSTAEVSPAVGEGKLDVETWEETDDPFELVARLLGAAGSKPAVQMERSAERGASLAVCWSRTGYSRPSCCACRTQSRTPPSGWLRPVLSDLRSIKDAEEIEFLRQAAHAADRVVEAIAAGRLVGRTEVDVANEVGRRLIDEGHRTAEFAIVGSGPNSASPHHEASDRVIGAGEPIVLDIGGRLGGYHSDVTRTLWVTGEESPPHADFAHLYAVLEAAQAAAWAAVSPGVPCEYIDKVARDAITHAGFGEQFIHRTGHGIGLDGHEDPYLVAGNDRALEVGHCFSVEPASTSPAAMARASKTSLPARKPARTCSTSRLASCTWCAGPRR